MRKTIVYKRIISLFCAVILIIPTTSIALAMDTAMESFSKESEFIYPETIELNDEKKVVTLETNNLNIENKTLIKTDFEAIYADDTNQYYEYIDELQVLPVEKEVIAFDKTTNIEVTFQNLDLPKEIVEELQKRQLQLDDGITKEITLFMPRKSSTRSNSETTYYTYKGQSFYDYTIYELDDFTPFTVAKKGKSASEFAHAIKTGVLVTVGFDKTVSGYAAGYTIFEEFLNFFGVTTVYPTSDDVIEMSHYFDHYTKLTYMEVPTSVGTSWYCGNIAQKMKMKKVQTRQKYQIKNSAGEYVNKERKAYKTLSGELSSPNYQSPKEIVYKLLYNKNPQDYKTNRENVKYAVPDTNISIGF